MSSLAILYSRAAIGIDAPLVTVEAHISGGLPRFTIVGLPEAAVRESKDRVRSAILNANFRFPNQRITINLAPAELPKMGSHFDLPIALGILAASKQIPTNKLMLYETAGELALDGKLRRINACIPIAIATQKTERQLIIPECNRQEAALISKNHILTANHLLDICAHLANCDPLPLVAEQSKAVCNHFALDLNDIKGQQHAKRALEIAASGEHSLLLFGPPGTGKTMLAERLPTILPMLSEQQAVEKAAILSIINKPINIDTWYQASFRAPHHTASSVALVGGGSPPRPGEISLAHNGILFLDELPEFNRHVLESLREPLESGKITISRATRSTEFPAKFQFIAAMNPCPCGYQGDSSNQCYCTPDQTQRYLNKLSGPFLDRIDMFIKVSRLKISELTTTEQTTTQRNSEMIKQAVTRVQQLQLQRQQCLNHHLKGEALEEHCQLSAHSKNLLQQAVIKYHLSMRSYFKILRVARTIADLAESATINDQHLLEALAYRIRFNE